MDVQSRHATRAGAVSERGDPSYLSLVTSGGRCTPCAAATLCTCWRFHGVRSCGISGPPPVPRASTRSVPRVRTHSVHLFTAATTISHQPHREYHHHLRESTTTTTAPAVTAVTATVTTLPPTTTTILRSWCCAVPSRYVPCTGHPGSSKAGAAGDGGSRAAGVAAAPVDGVGRRFTVGDGQCDEKVRRCHGQIGISHADG